MASSWGTSWGTSWGNSWGSIIPIPPVVIATGGGPARFLKTRPVIVRDSIYLIKPRPKRVRGSVVVTLEPAQLFARGESEDILADLGISAEAIDIEMLRAERLRAQIEEEEELLALGVL